MADGGLVSYYEDGGDVNTTVVDRGKKNQQAIKTFFTKLFDSKQGIHPDVKEQLLTAIDFVPILGDAKAAYDMVEELKKDPINWTMVGILGGTAMIGLIPGAGDTAAAAIRAGARSARGVANVARMATTKIVDAIKSKLQVNAVPQDFTTNISNWAERYAQTGESIDDFLPKLRAHAEEIWNTEIRGKEFTVNGQRTTYSKRTLDFADEADLDAGPRVEHRETAGEIVVPEINSMQDYIVTLHEFGHVLDKAGRPTKFRWTQRKALAEELGATNFAFKRAEEAGLLTREMVDELVGAMQSYMEGYALPYDVFTDAIQFGDTPRTTKHTQHLSLIHI